MNLFIFQKVDRRGQDTTKRILEPDPQRPLIFSSIVIFDSCFLGWLALDSGFWFSYACRWMRVEGRWVMLMVGNSAASSAPVTSLLWRLWWSYSLGWSKEQKHNRSLRRGAVRRGEARRRAVAEHRISQQVAGGASRGQAAACCYYCYCCCCCCCRDPAAPLRTSPIHMPGVQAQAPGAAVLSSAAIR